MRKTASVKLKYNEDLSGALKRVGISSSKERSRITKSFEKQLSPNVGLWRGQRIWVGLSANKEAQWILYEPKSSNAYCGVRRRGKIRFKPIKLMREGHFVVLSGPLKDSWKEGIVAQGESAELAEMAEILFPLRKTKTRKRGKKLQRSFKLIVKK